MISALKDLQNRFDFTFDVLDVDRRSEFEADWGDKVPVLLDGETEICHYFLDLDRLTQHLADTRPPP
jgi:thioredoxin reductase (NADPH)